MAVASIIPSKGSVAYGTLVADYASFDINGGQAVDNVTPYSASNVCSKNVGSGCPSFGFNIGAFALAHSSGTPPNLSNTSTIFSSAGATATLQLEGTAVVYTFTGIVGTFRIGHARMRGYVPFGISMANAGEVTEVWAVA